MGLSQREIGEALDISFQQVKMSRGLARSALVGCINWSRYSVSGSLIFDDVRGEPPSWDECLQLFRAFIAVRNANVKIIIYLVVSLAAEFALLKE